MLKGLNEIFKNLIKIDKNLNDKNKAVQREKGVFVNTQLISSGKTVQIFLLFMCTLVRKLSRYILTTYYTDICVIGCIDFNG